MAFEIVNPFAGDLTRILITFVVPFFIFFTVLLLGLKMSHVFGRNNFVYIVLALGLTIMLYSGKPETFQFLAAYLFQIGVAGSIIALGGVIVIIFFAIIRKGYSIAESMKGDEQKIKNLRKEEAKLMQKFSSQGILGIGRRSPADKVELANQLKTIENQIRWLEAKRNRRY